MLLRKRSNILFLLLVAAFLAYGGYYIFKTSFIVEGTRYFILNDDAMISMRYARNLAEGHGLVWNPGERVEGITNPLWAGYMALWHLTPLPPNLTSLPIQMTGLLLLTANLFVVRGLAQRLFRAESIGLLAALLTAFYYPLNNWALLGMEVGALTLLVSLAVYRSVVAQQSGRFSATPYWLLGVATLVRIDAAVPFLVILGVNVLLDAAQRRRHLLTGGLILLGFLGGQTVLRYAYYGEWLPNTYYLKVEGVSLVSRIKNGLAPLLRFVWNMEPVLFLLPFLLPLFRRHYASWLIVLVIAAQLVYSVYVGGDAWEHRGGANRYISIAMPLFFLAYVAVVRHIWQAALATVSGLRWPAVLRLVSQAGLLALVGLSLLRFNALLGTHSLNKLVLRGLPTFVDGNVEYVRIANALNRFAEPDARIAVVTAGVIPYLTDLYSIDLLGKSDPVIAHLPSHTGAGFEGFSQFRPGHSKWDYQYSIVELQPDIVVQLWADADSIRPYIREHYTLVESNGFTFSALTGSPNIDWAAVTILDWADY